VALEEEEEIEEDEEDEEGMELDAKRMVVEWLPFFLFVG